MIVYNAAAVAAAEAPKDWDDLLDPRWKGKIIIRYPLASGNDARDLRVDPRALDRADGSTAQGFDWLRRLDAQTKSYEMNASVLVQRIARREGLVTVWDLPDVLLEMKHSKDLAYVFPASGTPVIDDAIGLVNGAKHPRRREGLHRMGREASRRSSSRRRRPTGFPRARTFLPPSFPTGRATSRKMVARRSSTGTCSSARSPAGWPRGTGKCGAKGRSDGMGSGRPSLTFDRRERDHPGPEAGWGAPLFGHIRRILLERFLLTGAAVLAFAAVAMGRVRLREIPGLLDARLLTLFAVLVVAVELGKTSAALRAARRGGGATGRGRPAISRSRCGRRRACSRCS